MYSVDQVALWLDQKVVRQLLSDQPIYRESSNKCFYVIAMLQIIENTKDRKMYKLHIVRINDDLSTT